MKLLEILKFELRYRVRRPATYIYFGILFVMCFVAATTDVVSIGGGVGQVKENAPINYRHHDDHYFHFRMSNILCGNGGCHFTRL